ncbi:hypothetical protein Tco_0611729, partial [Tanacetum coccineum]
MVFTPTTPFHEGVPSAYHNLGLHPTSVPGVMPPCGMLKELTRNYSKFKEQIRVYNNMFCFTSFGAKIDHSINTGRASYTFRINSQNYHQIGSLLPAKGVPPSLRLLSERTSSRQYNAPTVSEVAALIVNDFGDCFPLKDIIVNENNADPQRISKFHLSYMALQYPLLFPYGEDGFYEKIEYYT